MKSLVAITLLIFNINSSFAGTTNGPEKDSLNTKYVNWHNLDPSKDKIQGVSTEKAYEILKGKKSRTITVAIIDSGVDIDHEDLNGKIWINEDETPGNGIDDDKNGYVDDINGWNFLGNSKGENIQHETLELTRLYKKFNKKYENISSDQVPPQEKKVYEQYLKIKKEYTKELEESKEQVEVINNILKNYEYATTAMKEYLGKENFSMAEVKSISSNDEQVKLIKNFLEDLYSKGFDPESFKEYQKRVEARLSYHLNPDYNPRSIIGDDPEDIKTPYGNNNVEGSYPEHGTFVAGIIGANRKNNMGMDGIADDVKLMVLRAVPDGDERDKDIANAIRYAVDNGAQIVNMSFGKSYSPEKTLVDKAIRYAEDKNVLLIHAAGNDGDNTDLVENYPTNQYSLEDKKASNWLNVGATSMNGGNGLVGGFSNYGKKTVDVFAPGVDIYSTIPNNSYKVNSGTSFAAPVTSGVAALLMAYYPDLTINDVKNIILKSTSKYKRLKVNQPSSGHEKKNKAKFKALSASGGVVNAYNAIKMADELSKNKKVSMK